MTRASLISSRRTVGILPVLLILLFGLSTSIARGSTLYGIGGASNAGELFQIDPNTGVGTFVGPLTFGYGFALDLATSGGNLYELFEALDGTATASIVRIDPATAGVISFTSPLDFFFGGAFTFRADGTVFLTSQGTPFGCDATLTSCAPDYGDPNFSPVADFSGLAFSSTGVLYGVSFSGDLYTIDTTPATLGNTTFVGSAGSGILNNGGLAFDPSTGILYGSSDDLGLYTINPQTGVGTVIGGPGYWGLAFLPDSPVPEPGTAVMMATAMILLLARKRSIAWFSAVKR